MTQKALIERITGKPYEALPTIINLADGTLVKGDDGYHRIPKTTAKGARTAREGTEPEE